MELDCCTLATGCGVIGTIIEFGVCAFMSDGWGYFVFTPTLPVGTLVPD